MSLVGALGEADEDAGGSDGQEERWRGVSPRLADVRRLLLLVIGVPVLLAAVAGLAVLDYRLAAVALCLGAAVLAGSWVLVARTVASWRYAERDDDLLIRRGVAFQQLVVVPYGRMQQVDVEAGPLDRRYGLATVALHTAAATSNATIPGLVPAEAARLRERLAALGEARSAGL